MFRHIIPLLTIANLAFASSRGFDERLADVTERMNKIEKQQKELQQKNASGSVGAKLPDAWGCPPNKGFFTTLDFLWWRASNDQFVYAFNNTSPFINAVQSITTGKWERMDWNWDIGFRMSGGWSSEYDAWSISANWTYYHNRTETKTFINNVNAGVGLTTNWINLPAVGTLLGVQSAVSKWSFNYNVIDLEWARSFFLTKFLSLQPTVSISTAFLYQGFRITYGANPGIALANRGPALFTGKGNFWGIGPRIGFKSRWHLGLGIEIFTNLAAALYYGRIDVHTTQRVTRNLNLTVSEDLRDDYWDSRPTIQTQLGLGWGTCFHKDQNYFSVSVAWEVNYWWDQLHISTQQLQFNNSPLTMQGITAKARLDF